MKNEINLLPPSAVLDRVHTIQIRRERTFFWAAVFSCGILLVTYGAIWQGLRSLQGSFDDQIVLQNKDRAAIVQRNKEVNAEIATLDQRIASYTLWTPHISEVTLAAPTGIRISRMELVEDSETLVITGKASNGSDVVEYQSALEKLPWVDHVVAPLQNFARSPEATVTFTIFHKKPPLL